MKPGAYVVAAVDPWSPRAVGGVEVDEDGDAVTAAAYQYRTRTRYRLTAIHRETGDVIDCGIDEGIPGVAKSRMTDTDDAEGFLRAEARDLNREFGGVFRFRITREETRWQKEAGRRQ